MILMLLERLAKEPMVNVMPVVPPHRRPSKIHIISNTNVEDSQMIEVIAIVLLECQNELSLNWPCT
jgi:hypothetical protein